LLGSVLEDRKIGIDQFPVLLHPLFAFSGIGPHEEILTNREFLENRPPFRNIGQTQAHDLLGILAVDLPALKKDVPFVRLILDEAHYGLEDGRLPGPVIAKNGRDRPLLHAQGDPADSVDQIVIGLDILYFQKSGHRELKIDD
jgi:hypothetical protein